jgi:hypothetical protein
MTGSYALAIGLVCVVLVLIVLALLGHPATVK